MNFCEKEIEQTKNEISEISDKLKNLVTAPEFTEITKTISTNEKSRNNELIQRKNRKFYRLKYNNNDERSGRNQNEQRRNERNTRGSHAGRQQRDNRNTDYSSFSETDQSDHDDRVLAAIDRRNARQQNGPKYPNYAAAVRRDGRMDNGNFSGRDQRHEQRRDDRMDNGNFSGRNQRNEQSREQGYGRDDRRQGNQGNRRSSFRNLRENETRQEHEAPIHERLALSRRNSRQNVNTNRNQTQEPRGRTEDDKEREIRELKNRLHSLENKPEQVIGHHVNQNTLSKNEQPAQRDETGQNTSDIHEMKQFLVGVMAAINEFDRKLTTQLDLSPTRPDRS